MSRKISNDVSWEKQDETSMDSTVVLMLTLVGGFTVIVVIVSIAIIIAYKRRQD